MHVRTSTSQFLFNPFHTSPLAFCRNRPAYVRSRTYRTWHEWHPPWLQRGCSKSQLPGDTTCLLTAYRFGESVKQAGVLPRRDGWHMHPERPCCVQTDRHCIYLVTYRAETVLTGEDVQSGIFGGNVIAYGLDGIGVKGEYNGKEKRKQKKKKKKRDNTKKTPRAVLHRHARAVHCPLVIYGTRHESTIQAGYHDHHWHNRQKHISLPSAPPRLGFPETLFDNGSGCKTLFVQEARGNDLQRAGGAVYCVRII